MTFETYKFIVEFNENDSFNAEFSEDDSFSVDFGANVDREYTGSYTVTPSTESQILPTANRIMTENIIVNPIPNNYGLITWDGTVLTVS